MGSSKSSTTSSGSSTSTTTPQETAYEKQINPLDVQVRQAMQQPVMSMLDEGTKQTMALLGGKSLGGAYSGIYGVNPSDQQAIVNQSMRDVPTSLQGTGMLDSGAAQSLYARGAENVRSQLAQFNTQAQQNAMGMGYAGIGQTLAPGMDLTQMLSQRLQSLRPTTTTGSYQGTSNTTNTPSFLQQLATGASAASSLMGSGGLGGAFLNMFSPNGAANGLNQYANMTGYRDNGTPITTSGNSTPSYINGFMNMLSGQRS